MRMEAERLSVTGWVRNTPDGTVEAVIQGPAEAVEAMIEWARSGPPLARVDRVEIGEADGVYREFLKRTD
ncbi:MAG: acylphosphatase [Hydrogenophilales bacterium 12-63-5]|nr:MAG: acylphosphatase [Hydrogenophilales bacterium 12-63-5]